MTTRRSFFGTLAAPFLTRLFRWNKPEVKPDYVPLADNFRTTSIFDVLNDGIMPDWTGDIYPSYIVVNRQMQATLNRAMSQYLDIFTPKVEGAVPFGAIPRVGGGWYKSSALDSHHSGFYSLFNRVELVSRPSRLQLYYARLGRMDEVVEIQMIRDAAVKLRARHRVNRELETALGFIRSGTASGNFEISDRTASLLYIHPAGYDMPSDIDLELALHTRRFETRSNIGMVDVSHSNSYVGQFSLDPVHPLTRFGLREHYPVAEQDVVYGSVDEVRQIPHWQEFTGLDLMRKIQHDRSVHGTPQNKVKTGSRSDLFDVALPVALPAVRQFQE